MSGQRLARVAWRLKQSKPRERGEEHQLSLSQASRGFGACYRGFAAFPARSSCLNTTKLRRLARDFPSPLPRSGSYGHPGLGSMKRLGVFLLPPGWDASLSQGYPLALRSRYPFIHLHGWREALWQLSVSLDNTTQWLRSELQLRPLDLNLAGEGKSLAIQTEN